MMAKLRRPLAAAAMTAMTFPAGAHVRAGSGEHAIALGDGSFVGFPTPCGQGAGLQWRALPARTCQ